MSDETQHGSFFVFVVLKCHLLVQCTCNIPISCCSITIFDRINLHCSSPSDPPTFSAPWGSESPKRPCRISSPSSGYKHFPWCTFQGIPFPMLTIARWQVNQTFKRRHWTRRCMEDVRKWDFDGFLTLACDSYSYFPARPTLLSVKIIKKNKVSSPNGRKKTSNPDVSVSFLPCPDLSSIHTTPGQCFRRL